MRIAIVGGGISGLVCAHLLTRTHEITLFESNDYVGGHTHTIPVDADAGTWPVDTGFIVYNERNYPNFVRLLRELNVPTQPSTMSFSVRCDRTGLEYNGSTLRQLFVQRRNLVSPSFMRMLVDVVRFNRRAPATLSNGATGMTLGAFLEAERYSRAFIDRYIVPMGSAIWSQPRDRVMAMPLDFFVRFFQNHGMLQVAGRPMWRTIQGGSARYVHALIAPFRDRIRLNHPVNRVVRKDDHVLVDGQPFDHVIFACHSDQALAILGNPTPLERAVLGALPYQPNVVTLHTDVTHLPRRRRAWAAWNYRYGGAETDPATVTYNMNILQSLPADTTFCVSLNSENDIAPARVIRRLRYDHPVYTREGVAAQRRHGDISGVDRTHFCGAYWGYGFHEDGVNSALTVCQRFGERL